MSDIFLSYASEDRPAAQQLSEVLTRHGWSVWWDRKILPGKTFDQVIGEALDAARCIVVLWSGASIQSDWVKEEASEGLARGVLVPVLIEDVRIPLGFRRIQAARLVDWKGADDHPDFMQLMASIQEIVSKRDMASSLVDYIADQFQREKGVDLRKEPGALKRLKEAADKARAELSSVQQTDVDLPFITADAEGPKHLRVKLTRAILESLTIRRD